MNKFKVDGDFKNINTSKYSDRQLLDLMLWKLSSIDDKLFISNGRLGRAERDISNLRTADEKLKTADEILRSSVNQHVLDCPIGKKVDDIKDQLSDINEDLLEYKFFRKYPKSLLVHGLAYLIFFGIIIAMRLGLI